MNDVVNPGDRLVHPIHIGGFPQYQDGSGLPVAPTANPYDTNNRSSELVVYEIRTVDLWTPMGDYDPWSEDLVARQRHTEQLLRHEWNISWPPPPPPLRRLSEGGVTKTRKNHTSNVKIFTRQPVPPLSDYSNSRGFSTIQGPGDALSADGNGNVTAWRGFNNDADLAMVPSGFSVATLIDYGIGFHARSRCVSCILRHSVKNTLHGGAWPIRGAPTQHRIHGTDTYRLYLVSGVQRQLRVHGVDRQSERR